MSISLNNLEEAEELCDYITIIKDGKIRAYSIEGEGERIPVQ